MGQLQVNRFKTDRPTVHAKGALVTGTFTPTSEAASLSSAQHFNQPSTPVTARFSSSTGIPDIPDTDPNANPRGLSIRFNLAEHVHTDIISHSTPLFPTKTGSEFLELLKAIAASPPGTASPSEVEKFLGSHPAALAFVQAAKPAPASFGKEAYYGVNAFKLVNESGTATNVRYRIFPVAGEENASEESLKEKDANFLYDELSVRLGEGPISFRISAQIAEEGDTTNDATVRWPESRKLVELGTVKLDSLVQDDAKEQKQIIYDPIPRIKGVEPSDDPLLEVRASVYLIGGKQRRAE